MYVLDSDIIIWILRGDRKIISTLDSLVGKNKTGISTITIAEIYKFTFPSEFVKNSDVIEQHQVFTVTSGIAKEAGLYWNQFHNQLLNLSLTDTIIAATAKAHDATLVSLNTRHFPMSDIKILNPLK